MQLFFSIVMAKSQSINCIFFNPASV